MTIRTLLLPAAHHRCARAPSRLSASISRIGHERLNLEPLHRRPRGHANATPEGLPTQWIYIYIYICEPTAEGNRGSNHWGSSAALAVTSDRGLFGAMWKSGHSGHSGHSQGQRGPAGSAQLASGPGQGSHRACQARLPCEHPEYLPSRGPAGSPGSPESRSRV
jgi:hypothetical protein